MPNAVVTGAGKRLGFAIGQALLEAGYDLELCVHSSIDGAKALAARAKELGRSTRIHQADLSSASDVDGLRDDILAGCRVIDLIVHNAGLFAKVPFGEVTREQYAKMNAVNVEAPFFLTQGLLPALERAADPSIIHITDIAAERPEPEYTHYSVSKAALDMLTRALAVELAPKIRVNAVAPGTVLFPEDFDEAAKDKILAQIPLAREGSAEEIAKAVVFLASGSDYIHGHTLRVDGGRSAQL